MKAKFSKTFFMCSSPWDMFKLVAKSIDFAMTQFSTVVSCILMHFAGIPDLQHMDG